LGCDGYYKLGRLGASTPLQQKEPQYFLNELKYWNTENNLPPELSNKDLKFPITHGIDIWALGLIVGELTSMGAKSGVTYSPHLMSLQQFMLHSEPLKRPTADMILQYLLEKESLIGSIISKASISEAKCNEPSSFSSSIIKLMNEKSTKYFICLHINRNWVMAATRDSNEEPNYKCMMELIKKAWEKPKKINKFYKSLQNCNKKANVFCILKSCIVLQHYFLYGPTSVFQPKENEKLPQTVLNNLAKQWPNVYSSYIKQLTETNKPEKILILGTKYIEFLIAKLKVFTQFKDCIEGSYAPKLETLKSLFEETVIRSLLSLWKLLLDLHLLIIEPPKCIWNIRLGIALIIAREEYLLISLIAHILKACKIFAGVTEMKESLQALFRSGFHSFFSFYGHSYKYFNTLRLIPELSERKFLSLPIGVEAYLNSFIPDSYKDLDELGNVFKVNNEIMGMNVPASAKDKIFKPINPKQESIIRPEIENKMQATIPIMNARRESGSELLTDFPQAKLKENLSKLGSTQNLHFAKFNEQKIIVNTSFEQPKQPQKLRSEVKEVTEMKAVIAPQVVKEVVTQSDVKAEVKDSTIQSVDLLGLDEDVVSSSQSTDPHRTNHSSNCEKAQYDYKSENSRVQHFTPVSIPITNKQEQAEELKHNNFINFPFVNNEPQKGAVSKEQAPKPLLNVITEEINKFRDSFFINISEIKIIEQVGCGASADVYRSLYRGTEVAVKVLRNLNEHDLDKVNELRRELNALLILRHPNLVLFMGTTVSAKGSIGLVTEFCSGGNLFNLLHESNVPLSWKQRCKMALDVAKGMNSLHSYKQPILHRDLKSLNLLLVEPVKGPYDPVLVKITDLGLARFQSSNQYMTSMAGTFHWMAPEVLVGKPYTIKADIYSYAIVLWEIITRKKPYAGMDPGRIMHLVLNLNQRPDITSIPSDCPPLVLSISL